jgi:hypothetical protein
MYRRVLSWAMVCLVAVQPAGAAGVSAAQEGPGTTAAAEPGLRKAANLQCFPGLESFLPGVYYECVGMRELARGHDEKGRQMLELAAGWASKPAQLALGVGSFNGDTAPLNRPLGLAWLGLAAERGEPTYVAIFKSAWAKADADERARAEELWQTMRPKYGDGYAARRAEQRYQRARQEMMDDEVYGAKVCIAGLTSNYLATYVDLSNPDQPSCKGSAAVTMVARRLDTSAAILFEGWSGHVSVGQLQQVAPGK